MSADDMVPPTRRDAKRLFSAAEKQYLFAEQEGRCPSCTDFLSGPVDAHHVVAHAEGGTTTLDNAALLCEPCHRSAHRPLAVDGLQTASGLAAREWQGAAVRRLRTYRNGTVIACPAAGKTLMGGFWLRDNIGSDAPFILIVSPSKTVRDDWRADITRHFGIQITARWKGSAINRDYQGASICYASLKPGMIDSVQLHASRRGLLLVLDEVHHGSDENSWGAGLEDLIAMSRRSLLLTGTPFRTDGCRIPGLSYGADKRVLPHFQYSYKEAIRDEVCRSVRFHLCDGEARYLRNGQSFAVRPSEADKASLSNVAATLYAPESDHLHELVAQTVDRLDEVRSRKPNAGALFVCRPSGNSQETSSEEDSRVEQVARKIREITGDEPVVVTSRDDRAHEKIADFRRSNAKYLVAINLVSEGVNIPRLQVACLLRHVQSEMLFRQLFGPGRVGRQTPGGAAEEAVVILSSFPLHEQFVSIIESESDQGVRDRQQRQEDEADSQAGREKPPHDFLPISASFEKGAVVAREKVYDAAAGAQIEAIQSRIAHGAGRDVPFEIAAQVRDLFGPVPGASIPEAAAVPLVDAADVEKRLRARLSKSVRRFCQRTGEQHSDVFVRLHQSLGFRNIKDAMGRGGNDALARYCDTAERWLEQSGDRTA